jgi:hypothetical protein
MDADSLEIRVLKSTLAVRSGMPSTRGRLHALWNEGEGLVSIVTREPGTYPTALNLANLVILDAEGDGRVLEIAIGVPVGRWQVGTFPELPEIGVEADLFLASDERDAYEDVPLTFLTNAPRNQLLVVIGTWSYSPDLRIDLSRTAAVLASRGNLSGILAFRGAS